MTSLFALGWTQHSIGSQNIRTHGDGAAAARQYRHCGRRHERAPRPLQHPGADRRRAACPTRSPAILPLPSEKEATFEDYMKTRQFKPSRPGQVSYWQNYRKFIVSFQKAIYGDSRNGGKQLGLRLAAEARRADVRHHSRLRDDEQRRDERIHLPGLQSTAGVSGPGQDPQGSQQAEIPASRSIRSTRRHRRFWEDFGPQNPADSASIETEVFQLPTTCFAEENGSLVNSARWLQWHWKAAEPPGIAKSDIWIMSGIFHRMRELYRKEGGAFPDPILNLSWNYIDPTTPDPEDLAKEMNGRARVDIADATAGVAAESRPASRRLRSTSR